MVKCVCLGDSRPKEKERGGREVSEVMCAWEHELVHGDPRGNKEVANESQPSSMLGCWAEKRRKERKNIGLLVFKPIL